MKRLLLDLLKYQTGFIVFYAILLAANIIKKDIFASPVYWLVLVFGNVAFILIMTVVHFCRLHKLKKK